MRVVRAPSSLPKRSSGVEPDGEDRDDADGNEIMHMAVRHGWTERSSPSSSSRRSSMEPGWASPLVSLDAVIVGQFLSSLASSGHATRGR